MFAVTEDTTGFSFLLSGTVLLLALVAFYVGRALWIVRHEWRHCRADTKALYVLVAPLLTLAIDVLNVTDRLFWSRKDEAGPSKPTQGVNTLRPKMAARSDG
jgi:hypothetical protein